jgi:hypothetical protein
MENKGVADTRSSRVWISGNALFWAPDCGEHLVKKD